ncbi:MAG: class II fructose-bisphosphate aldolase [Anaerolineales bacterium]|nr:class II fructose-bisphosphate aldolase [Anaerolineales bacterium]
MYLEKQQELINLLDGAVELKDGQIEVLDENKLQRTIENLVKAAVVDENEDRRYIACYLVRKIAAAAGIYPTSIHDLYLARGRGEVPNNFTVPAINLRGLTFYAARIVFEIANKISAGAFIFEIARSETGYTDQRPSEYSANILGAAISAGYKGPVFIQGDHYQISAARYNENPDPEIKALKELTQEALNAGFFNIDVDASTLVDLSKNTVIEQQVLNSELTAMFTKYIRDLEPEGITVSIGGEIGEVGEENSTEEELRAFLDNYINDLKEIDPDVIGLSKISVLTGTSHGGVVLPDGSIKEVAVDFDLLQHLGKISRESYGLGGSVQHGASTLPETAFSKFAEYETLEVHLATNFQNILYDELPADLKSEIYAYLDKNHANERKSGQTDEQFYYKTRKRALGVFKHKIWNISPDQLAKINAAWEIQFRDLFDRLGIADTYQYVDQHIREVNIEPKLEDYLLGGVKQEDTSDLAD